MNRLLTASAVVLLAAILGGQRDLFAEEAPAAAREGSDYFESKIRPLFVARCQECHGEKKQEMGLRFDQREAFFRGSDQGPVVIPGEPEKSSLIEAVRHNSDIQMPPAAKLPDEEIAALTTWVKLGAPWPEEKLATAATPTPAETAKAHWAFKAVAAAPLPETKNTAWVKTAIDRFVLAKLESSGLEPSPAVDRRTLIRRATFDLIGLPPTPEEVEAFVADTADDAYARLIDRLLESPHYGERWGRYWLDVARYADTKGYSFDQDRELPHAYLYRDWVVQALNEDLPYDQFLVQQIAADRLENAEKSSLAAMGFLTLGRRFLNNKQDIIDDRLDVLFRGTQGLTISCARCHDHKYDPIPAADYYSMYGVFDDSEEKTVPLEVPSQEYLAELAKREAAEREYIAAERTTILDKAKSKTAEYLLAAHAQKGRAAENQFMFVQADAELQPAITARWRSYIDGLAKDTPQVWRVWFELTAVKPEEFAGELEKILNSPQNDPAAVNRLLLVELQANRPKSVEDLARCYTKVINDVDAQWKRELEAAKGEERPKQLADTDAEQFRQVYSAKDAPLDLQDLDFKLLLAGPVKKQIDNLRAEITKWQTSENAPRYAYVLEDKASQSQPRVFIRGNAGNPGQPVPKQFPGVVSADGRKPFTSGSGRLETARIIASPNNPLTARVLVNRVWMYHFNAPLVATPSDFGTRSEPPTHPELLDYLASEFMTDGWSLKKLHRRIMLSAAYQQASEDRTECVAVDPTNQLLWKMNRRRLDWEALRDSIAFVSGTLDLTVGGKAVDMFATRNKAKGFGVKPVQANKGGDADEAPPRRTIYGYIDRQNLPSVLRTFDFALPDTHSPRRFATVVPPQALYLMNNQFVAEQAAHFARRSEIASIEDETRRIEQMYAIAFGRLPSAKEAALAQEFVKSQATTDSEQTAETKLNAWDHLSQALLMTNEFTFVD